MPTLPPQPTQPGDSLHPLLSKETKGLFSEHVCETRESGTEIMLVYLDIKDYISICSPYLLSLSQKTLQGVIFFPDCRWNHCYLQQRQQIRLFIVITTEQTTWSSKQLLPSPIHPPHTSNTFLTANRWPTNIWQNSPVWKAEQNREKEVHLSLFIKSKIQHPRNKNEILTFFKRTEFKKELWDVAKRYKLKIQWNCWKKKRIYPESIFQPYVPLL